MIIMKFGGASLSTAKGIIQAIGIIKKYQKKTRIVLIVSAMKDVTDKLYGVSEYIRNKELPLALKELQILENKHLTVLREIDPSSARVKVECELINLISRLRNFLKNVTNKEITKARTDYIVSFGERLSCLLVAHALNVRGISSHPIDASFLLITTNRFGNAVPIYKTSQKHITKILEPLIENSIIPVVTGFIGSTSDGCTTTLGRGGSDLSASYLANLLDAEELILWKDVTGIYDSDPHLNPNARIHRFLSYEKARKMAINGAKVIYYKAIDPVRKKNIPIYIKNFLFPEVNGSKIGKRK